MASTQNMDGLVKESAEYGRDVSEGSKIMDVNSKTITSAVQAANSNCLSSGFVCSSTRTEARIIGQDERMKFILENLVRHCFALSRVLCLLIHRSVTCMTSYEEHR